MNNEYERGIRTQKVMGWVLVVIGTVWTLSILFAIFGIPLLIIGIALIKSKEVSGLIGWSVKNQIRKK